MIKSTKSLEKNIIEDGKLGERGGQRRWEIGKIEAVRMKMKHKKALNVLKSISCLI